MTRPGFNRMILVVSILLVILTQASVVQAQQEASAPETLHEGERSSGNHQHDGLMVSMQMVGGFIGLYSDSWVGNLELPAGQMIFSVGYSFNNKIALHGELMTGYPVVLAGGGGARIFMPANTYLNLSVGGVYPGVIYGKLVLGKEWWVSDNWGLGLGLSSMVAGLPGSTGALVGAGLGFSATYN